MTMLSRLEAFVRHCGYSHLPAFLLLLCIVSKIIILKLLLSFLFFFLFLNASKAQNDTTIHLNEVVISSSKLPFSSGLKEYTIDSSLLTNYQNLSLADLLNECSALNLKNYGSGELSTLSLRGGSSYHTAVLWNGFSLASPLHGLTDLTLENNFFFDDITLQYGGASTIWGSGAVSGSVHLNNKPNFNSGLKITSGIHYGSFSDLTEFTGISWGNNFYSGSLKFFNKNNENDFTYYNENTQSKEKQINAQVKQDGFIFENYFRTGNLSILNFKAWYTYSNRHIPPALSQVNSQAIQKDINTRFSAEWKRQGKNVELVLRSAFFHEILNYNDDAILLSSNNKSKNINIESSIGKYFFKSHFLQFGLNNTYSIADSSANFSRSTVNRFALFASYRYTSSNEKIDLSLSARKEFSSLTSSPVIISGGINYYPLKFLQLHFSSSGVYRNPTLNDLYWTPGGNINLKPENGFSIEGGFQIDLFKIPPLKNKYSSSTLTFNATAFYKKINDWIIWYPSSSFVWRPQNLLLVKSHGTEINIHYMFKKNNFSAGINLEYFYTISTNEKPLRLNDASLHRQLIYIPQNKWNVHLVLTYKSFSLNFNHSYTGLRYTTSDNTSSLSPYSLDNFEAGKVFKTNSISFRFFLKINNIFNSDYQSVLNRPMPLRSYNAGISFTFQKKLTTKKIP